MLEAILTEKAAGYEVLSPSASWFPPFEDGQLNAIVLYFAFRKPLVACSTSSFCPSSEYSLSRDPNLATWKSINCC